MVNAIQRIFFLLLMILGVFTSPWPLVFGMLFYTIARFHWFVEAILLGVVLDTISGIGFGFFTILFTTLILISEVIGKFFQEDNMFSVVGKSATLLLAFFILNMAGLIILNWRASVYLMGQFWYEGFSVLFYGALWLVVIFSIHFLMYFIYRLWRASRVS